MPNYPTQLIERIQKHFANKFHKTLTSEEACDYLDAWGRFYLTVVDWDKRQATLAGADGSPTEGGGRPPLNTR